MVQRNLSLPFRFICLTDDYSGLDENIERFPIPDVGVDIDDSEGRKRVQAWKKLTTFAEHLYDFEGTCLFLDLDVVIVDSIDCYFEPEGDFFIIKDWGDERENGNSSIYRFTAGALSEVLDYFCANRDQIVEEFGNEQEYLTDRIRQMGKLQFWPSEWCLSYKHDCLPHNRLKRWFAPASKPEHGKIIVFHGSPNPDEAVAGIGDRWYRRLRPAPWILNYWR